MVSLRTCSCSLLLAAACLRLCGQTPAPAPDVLVFANGEKLIGHFVSAHGSTVTFKSDSVGEIKVDWSKIAELHTSQIVAVVGKNVRLSRRSDLSQIPRGPMEVTNKNVTLAEPGKPPVTVPVADAAHIIDQATFEKDVLHNPGFTEAWNGTITAGASLVYATQQSRTFTGNVALIRAIPAENWMDARNRTLVNFSAATGFLKQPGSPKLKTEILHSDVERDQYFHGGRVFGFAQAAWDHNFSQGLDLQQTYGGGIGVSMLKEPNTTLDLRGSMVYIRQAFQVAANDENLIASIFAQNFSRKFGRGILFLEQISATPAWNVPHAWGAGGNASLNIPVFKRLSFTTGVLDTFLNNPPPGFKKNSFQFTTGLTYGLR